MAERNRSGWLFTCKTGGELSDYGSGDGETHQEGPVPVPFSLEENRPWIELPHFSLLQNPASASPPFSDSQRRKYKRFCAVAICSASTPSSQISHWTRTMGSIDPIKLYWAQNGPQKTTIGL